MIYKIDGHYEARVNLYCVYDIQGDSITDVESKIRSLCKVILNNHEPVSPENNGKLYFDNTQYLLTCKIDRTEKELAGKLIDILNMDDFELMGEVV